MSRTTASPNEESKKAAPASSWDSRSASLSSSSFRTVTCQSTFTLPACKLRISTHIFGTCTCTATFSRKMSCFSSSKLSTLRSANMVLAFRIFTSVFGAMVGEGVGAWVGAGVGANVESGAAGSYWRQPTTQLIGKSCAWKSWSPCKQEARAIPHWGVLNLGQTVSMSCCRSTVTRRPSFFSRLEGTGGGRRVSMRSSTDWLPQVSRMLEAHSGPAAAQISWKLGSEAEDSHEDHIPAHVGSSSIAAHSP
mmetsp:Transcript_3115/g.8835  ORF Transcript_3115/g.8835 Transcript_3115/m.8835 type:complete len:250 (-) Transcript_3115:2418-3167(-)